MHPRFPLLFSPLRIGSAEAKNRIVSTSHDAHFGEGGYPADRSIRYHVEKARGGAGLVQAFGTTSVHPSSPGGPGSIQNFDHSPLSAHGKRDPPIWRARDVPVSAPWPPDELVRLPAGACQRVGRPE